MANLSSNVKTAFLKGLEALGKTASSLSDAASQKLNEMNLDARRREVLAQIPKCVMQLWKDGIELPEPLTDLLNELTEVENKLSALRPKHETEPAVPTEETQSAETAEEAAEETEKDPSEEIVESTVEVLCPVVEEPADETVEEAAEEPADEAPAFVRPAEEAKEEAEDNGYNDVTEIADEPDAE